MHRILAYILFLLFFVSSLGDIAMSIYSYHKNSSVSWMMDADEEEGTDQELKIDKQEKLFVGHYYANAVTSESLQDCSKRHYYMHQCMMNDDNYSRIIDSPPEVA